MLTVLGALWLLGLVLVPGYAAVRVGLARRDGNALVLTYPEAAAVTLAWGVLPVGWLALLLVELGVLSLPLLTALIGAITAGLLLLARRRAWPALPLLTSPRWADWAFVAAALLALALAARPHEMIVGGMDAGIYANTGAHIARTGQLLIHDPMTLALAPTVGGPRVHTDTPDAAPGEVDGAVRHLMLRLPVGRFPFADYLRLAGFYVLDFDTGAVTPQFLHLYPTWLGLTGMATGDVGMLYATPLLAWLGMLMIGLAGARLFGPWVGAATVLVLGMNSLQIWFARQSLSEALLEFLLCATVYGWVAAHSPEESNEQRATSSESRDVIRSGRRGGSRTAPLPATAPRPFFLALAGMALGSFALAHAQFVFAFALLPPLAVWLWLARRWRAAYWAFFGPILALLVHASIHIALFALGYFEGLYHHIILDDLWPRRWLLAGLALVAALALALLNRWRERWWPYATDVCYGPPRWEITPRRAAPIALAATTCLVLLYAYLIRPGILAPGALAGYIGAPTPTGPELNLVRLGWYLSPLGMVLAIVGATVIVARFQTRLLPLLGLAGVFGLAFNLASFTHESYIYSLRRFVPIVLPALSLAVAYAAVVVAPRLAATLPIPNGRRLGQMAGGGALALLALFFAYTGRTIISHVEYEGVEAQVAAIANRFDQRDIIIFSGPRDEPHKLATPLLFFHGLDALVVSTNNPRGDLIADWARAQEQVGRRLRVVLGNNGGKLELPGYRLEPVAPLTLTLSELERLEQQKPYNIQTNTLEYTLYDALPATGPALAGPPYRVTVGSGDELATVVGWYGREQDASALPYRWTNGDALLRLPWPSERGPMRLRITLSGGVRPAELGPATVELLLARGQNDREAPHLATLTLTEEFATYEVTVPPDLLPDQPTGAVMLQLRNTAWIPAEIGHSPDPRLLGVRFAGLELASCQAASCQ